MRPVSASNFGLLIAYLLPGFTCLWGLSYASETVRSWLGTNPTDAPTVGGFLYVTLASVGAGLTVSTVRWLVIDTIHHWTGVPRPRWDFSRLQDNIGAFDLIVEHQFRYAQFNGGMLISLVLVYVTRRLSLGFWSCPVGWTDFVFVLLAVIFYIGSRNTYYRYVLRGNMMLGTSTQPPGGAQERSGLAGEEQRDSEAGDGAKSVRKH